MLRHGTRPQARMRMKWSRGESFYGYTFRINNSISMISNWYFFHVHFERFWTLDPMVSKKCRPENEQHGVCPGVSPATHGWIKTKTTAKAASVHLTNDGLICAISLFWLVNESIHHPQNNRLGRTIPKQSQKLAKEFYPWVIIYIIYIYMYMYMYIYIYIMYIYI